MFGFGWVMKKIQERKQERKQKQRTVLESIGLAKLSQTGIMLGFNEHAEFRAFLARRFKDNQIRVDFLTIYEDEEFLNGRPLDETIDAPVLIGSLHESTEYRDGWKRERDAIKTTVCEYRMVRIQKGRIHLIGSDLIETDHSFAPRRYGREWAANILFHEVLMQIGSETV